MNKRLHGHKMKDICPLCDTHLYGSIYAVHGDDKEYPSSIEVSVYCPDCTLLVRVCMNYRNDETRDSVLGETDHMDLYAPCIEAFDQYL